MAGSRHPRADGHLPRGRGSLEPVEALRRVLRPHVDSKATTPGPFDNAASVATLLTLIEVGHLDDLPPCRPAGVRG